MRTVYLIGEPGSGKSTAMRAAIELCGFRETGLGSIPMLRWAEYVTHDGIRVAQLGIPEGLFPGTDRLSMGVQPVAIDWLRSVPAALVLGEGDRLATDGFLRAAAEVSHLTVCVMSTSPEIAAARRAMRGTTQSEAWVKGRRTKVERLASNWCAVSVSGAMELADVLCASL